MFLAHDRGYHKDLDFDNSKVDEFSQKKKLSNSHFSHVDYSVNNHKRF